MTSELLTLLEYYEKEKGIDRETMIEAISTALLAASKKSIGPARELRIEINPEKGKIQAIAKLIATEKVSKPYEEISLSLAEKIKPGAAIGDEIDVDITPKNFGRIAAQAAKQAMMQRLRQAEKAMVYDEFKDRVGEITGGVIRRFERSDVVVDLGKFEALMPSRERVATEDYNIGDRIRAYIVAVENATRGPEVILSRSHPNFVRRLFEFECSEISDRTVEIRSIAREAGYRTKIAVYSANEKIDPVGACVGLRGARVKNIVRELNNEKVDIIRWSDDPRDLVIESLKPIKPRTIEIDEEKHSIRVTVEEEDLSKAIGRRGQNARLTSRLIGWDVQVEKDQSEHDRFEQQVFQAAKALAQQIEIPLEQAESLVRGGISTVEVFAEVSAQDIADIAGLELEQAEQIFHRVQGLLSKEKKPTQGQATATTPESTEETNPA